VVQSITANNNGTVSNAVRERVRGRLVGRVAARARRQQHAGAAQRAPARGVWPGRRRASARS
jgi:hypothetical protein